MKIDFNKVETWLVLFFVFLIVFCLVLFKILGASELPKQFMERGGYCKLEFGDDWIYSVQRTDTQNYSNTFDDENHICQRAFESQPFSIDNFEKVCPDKKFFSIGFYSKCFKLGRGG